SKLKHEHLEKQVLETADTIIVTSENTKREFEGKTDKPVVVITNGYDGHRLQNIDKDATFTISHIGSLLSGRNPKNLWAVLSELVKEHQDFEAQFRLKLIGVVSEDVIGEIRRNGLENHVDVLGYMEHSEALLW